MYCYELTHDDHVELIACLLSFRGMVIVSEHNHQTYEPKRRAGWCANRVSHC